MTRRIFTRLSVAVIIGVLAACGGDADDSTTTQADDVGADTTVAAPTATEPDDSDDGGSDSGGVTTVCIEATQAMAAAIGAYSTGLTEALGGTLDPDALGVTAGQLEAMADAAPAEIKDDFEVITEEIVAFYQAMGDLDYEPGSTPTPDQMEELARLSESIDQEAFDEASANIETWFEENC